MSDEMLGEPAATDLPPEVSPQQIRAARDLLGWSEGELAAHAGLDTGLVHDVERGKVSPALNDARGVLMRTLAAAGARFEHGAGVALADMDGDALTPSELNAQNDV